MNRWKAYGKGDTQVAVDGDVGFQGTDMLHERSFLQPRMLARCENKRLWDGPAATRAGTTFPGDFNPAFEGRIIGSAIYSNPNGDEIMLVATAKDTDPKGCTYIWQLQFGKDPKQIPLGIVTDPPGPPELVGQQYTCYPPASSSPINSGVEFTQAYDKVIMQRRLYSTTAPFNPITLIWDGDPNSTGTKFEQLTLSTDGLKLAPRTWYAEPFENRVIYYFTPGILQWTTQFAMSDVLDPTSYDDIYGVFRVSAAGSDRITRLLAYQKGAIIAFMRNSVYMIENFTVDPNQTTQRVLSSKVGSLGNKVPINIGAEIFFLSEPGGFYKVSQIIQDTIAYEPIPLSMPIQPIIDRINWHRTDVFGLDFCACSAALGPYVYFAVPLDDKSGANDAILVYNTVTQQWESGPDWLGDPDFRINALHVTHYDMARRLFALDYDAKKIYLLYDGTVDHINGVPRNINDTIETRGYVCNDPGGFKRFERLIIGVTTVSPQMTITAISEGVNEQQLIVADLTKDPTQSYIHGRGPTSVDPSAPKLEDYGTGLDFDQAAVQDFESLLVGDISVLPEVSGTGAPTEVAQQSLERFQLRQVGRWVSIRIENKSGNCNIGGVAVEGIPIEETIKVIA